MSDIRMTDSSPLEDVLIEEEELNEELLAETVSKYTKVSSESGSLVPEPPFQELASKGKILVALLAQKVRFELDMVEGEWLTPTEISEMTGIKTGTIYPAIRKLADNGLVQDEDGDYRIPTVKIEAVKSFLGDSDE